MGSDLTEGGVFRTVFYASMPMVAAFLLQSSFNVVDALFIGWISPEALAAVSVSFPVIFFMMSVGTGIGAGATSAVARLIGSGDYRGADNAAEHAVLISIVLGVLFTVAGVIGAPFIFDMIGVEGEVKAMGLEYLNVILWFTVFFLFSFIASSVIRGEGDMKTPMIVMAFGAVLNAVLDPIMIFWMGWGLGGAAWATVLAQIATVIVFIYHLSSGRGWIRLDFRDFSYDFLHVKRIFSVGIPSCASNIIMSVGMFIFTFIVAGFGTHALAAFSIGFRLDSFAILPGIGVAVAVISVVGQSVGAGKYSRAREVAFKAGALACSIQMIVGLVFYVFAQTIVGLFTDSPEVLEYGVSFMRIIPLSYLIVGFSMSFSGAFIGSGRAGLALLVTFLRLIVFSAPLAILLSQSMGLDGVWWGIVIGSWLSFIAAAVIYRFTKWEKTSIQSNP
jgi:putative MATE family efflux protein